MEISGKKIWLDENDAHGLRPESITVQLYADGVLQQTTPTWRDTDTSVWTYSFGRLPERNTNGATIVYTVTETPVAGYETRINGLTITNKLIPQEPKAYAEISGSKTWNDNDNAAGARPTTITVSLLRDGVEVDQRNVNAANGWTYSFGSLPEDDGYGHEYTYTVREAAVPGYFARYDGLNVTNTYLGETPPAPNGETPDGAKGILNRKTSTPAPNFGGMTEEEFNDLLDMLGYGTPLFGILGTGDETPAWPFVFGGIGLLALALALLYRRRQRA